MRSLNLLIVLTLLLASNFAFATGGGGGGGGGGGSSVPNLHIALQILFVLVVALIYRKKK